MLLPTQLFIIGGALAVLISVAAVAALPALPRLCKPSLTFQVPVAGGNLAILTSLAGLAFIAIMIAAGYWGPADPISNPLPGAVWTLWWVGFTWLSIFIGNLWSALNPWTGLYALIAGAGWRPPFRLPHWIGCWPAVLLFFGFAWFELVYPTPSDPPRLATAVLAYLAFTSAMLLLFGARWLRSGECFSIYFRVVSWLSPLQWSCRRSTLALTLGIPGFALLRNRAVSPSLSAMILLALAAVSFDGFSRTFFWVAGQGINPLEFPGRSAVTLSNSVAFAVLSVWMAVIFRGALTAGRLLAASPPLPQLALSIVPIAFAYHLAHYLPEFPVSLMNLAKALGAAGLSPPASIMMDHQTAAMVFQLQTAIIVLGHISAVVTAHLMALRVMPPGRAALSLLPLNAVMVLYTVFGLWLLATPVVS